MRWLVAVFVFGLGCRREAARVFGIEFAKFVVPCDREKLETRIDRELLIDRAIAGRALKRRDMDELRTSFVSTLCNSLDGSWRARFVRNRIDNGVPKPVIRLTSDAGVEYLELELDSRMVRSKSSTSSCSRAAS